MGEETDLINVAYPLNRIIYNLLYKAYGFEFVINKEEESRNVGRNKILGSDSSNE